MPSYAAGARDRTPARPMPLAAPHAREPTAIPAADAAPSRGPPRTALPITRTSSGPGESDSTAASSTNPQRPSMPGRRRVRRAGSVAGGHGPAARGGVPDGGRGTAGGEAAQTSGAAARPGGGAAQAIVEPSRTPTAGRGEARFAGA